ncbi:MAG: low molecular weight phosphotyrosine protein phosphatase, partial [Myxococcales bacterium]|nr:low molecular weight phosphotyrosine protein phosphatase [Myxococcales bacterium]
TGHWHAGEAPDPRSVEEAQRHGVDISGQRARQFTKADFRRFEHIVVMDGQNRRDVLRQAASPADEARVSGLLDHTTSGPGAVPDPYYGGPQGFGHVWSLVDGATADLLARIRAARGF